MRPSPQPPAPPRKPLPRSPLGPHAAGLRVVLVSLLVLSVATPAAAEVSVQMRAQPTRTTLDGRVVLHIQVSSDSVSGPKIRIPDLTGFEVLQQSVSRPMQFNFGLGGQSVRSQHQYKFVLRPLRAGKLVIEPTSVTLDGSQTRSAAVTIQVDDAAGQGSGQPAPRQAPNPAQAQPNSASPAEPGAQPAPAPQPAAAQDYADAAEVDPVAFIRTVVDKPRPFVREQVTVTLYLYVRDRLQAAPAIDLEPSTDGLWTHDLLPSYELKREGRQRVGRVAYNVYLLRRFAAFPLRPGPATIGPLALSINRANLFDSLLGRGARGPLKRSGVPIELDVQALPEGGPASSEVLVGKLSIEARLDRAQVATGDAVTLTATVKGSGHLQTLQLPKPVIEGVDVFEPQVRDLIEATEGTVGGTRIYEWLLVPRRPGRFNIPAFEVPTFATKGAHYRVARSQPLVLTAAGQAATVATAPAGPSDEDEAADSATPEAELEVVSLPPLRTRSALLRRDVQAGRGPGYWALLAAAPTLWLLAWVGGGLRQRWLARARDGHGRARREVDSHLNAANLAAAAGDGRATHAAIAAALQVALETALGEPIGSHTRDRLDGRLAAAGMDEPVRRAVLDTLERCDAARFSAAPEAAGALQDALAGTRELTASIARMGADR